MRENFSTVNNQTWSTLATLGGCTSDVDVDVLTGDEASEESDT